MMQGLHVNDIESNHKEKGIHKAKAALRHSTMEIQSKKDQKITKRVRFHYEYKDGHGPGSQQPGDAKISSEAAQGCKDIPPPVAGSKWGPRVLHSEERNLMAVPVAVGPQEREAEEPKSWRVARASCSSHALRATGQFVFCRACGAYTGGRHSSALRVSCVGFGRAATQTKLLRDGRHPVTGFVLGRVHRWVKQASCKA